MKFLPALAAFAVLATVVLFAVYCDGAVRGGKGEARRPVAVLVGK